MTKMPVLFVGHGSPMNALEKNSYTQKWQEVASVLPTPKAIISISAHWYTRQTRIMNEEKPKTIYDMYGFPKELYEIVYDAPGSSTLASTAKKLISKATIFDNTWGIDHGTWSVLVHMFPKKDIPLFQISIDALANPLEHYKIGTELKTLREQGVLLFGTGNIVHNLRLVDWHKANKGYDWAYEFDEFVYENITNHNHEAILQYQNLGEVSKLAVPTPDHFYPLLYILGATDKKDKITVFNKACELGSLTMTSYLWQ